MPSYRAPVPPALHSWEEVPIEAGTEPDEYQTNNILELTDSAPPLAGRLANFTLLPRYVSDISYELGELRVLTDTQYKRYVAGKQTNNPAWAYEAVIRLLVSDAKKLIKENVDLRAKMDGREGGTMTPSSSGTAPSGGKPFFSSNPSSRSQSGESLGAPADHSSLQQHSQHHSAADGTIERSPDSVPAPQLHHATGIDGSTPVTVGSASIPRPFPSAPAASSRFPMMNTIPSAPSLHLVTSQSLGSLEDPRRLAKPSGMTDTMKSLEMGGQSGNKRTSDAEGGTMAKRALYGSDGRCGAGDAVGEAIEEVDEDEEDLDHDPTNLLEE